MNAIAAPQRALIIGASRGLGLGLVKAYLDRGWHVTATARSAETAQGLQALQEAHAGELTIRACDINDPDSVAVLARALSHELFDVLFVNAGISRGADDNVSLMTTDDFVELMVTNALSPVRVITELLPCVREMGTVAVMSSNLASVANNTTGMWEVYRASKASLNTLLRSLAVRRQDRRTYICVSPGWVRTDMGGEAAPLDVTTSVAGIVRTLAARTGSTGVHFVDYQNIPIDW